MLTCRHVSGIITAVKNHHDTAISPPFQYLRFHINVFFICNGDIIIKNRVGGGAIHPNHWWLGCSAQGEMGANRSQGFEK